MTKYSSLFALSLLLALPATAAAPFDVKDTQGRALSIELVSLEGSNVTFKTSGKEHTLTLDRFDDESQKRIKDTAKDLPPVIPKLDVDVSVNNKRQKVGYYKANQTVSQKVILKNMSPAVKYPASKGFIVSIGQDRAYKDHFKVMQVTNFEFSVEPNRTFESETVPFSTTYDAENKGAGNVGGYEYDYYILVITNQAGEVMITKTMDGNMKTVMDKDRTFVKKVMTLKKDQIVDKNLDPLDVKE